MRKIKPKVFTAMSGGVDSSVAALLLKKQGYNVTGVFMRCYNIDGCSERDAEDARRVAAKLNIPFYVFDFEEEYKREVVKYMIDGYRQGITPNPDVMCNKQIKFGLFLEKALSLGADFIATGHYIRIAKVRLTKRRGLARPAARSPLDSRPRSSDATAVGRRPCPLGLRDTFLRGEPSLFTLFRAKDKNKDQSYFLWILTQEQLKYCLFPIGDYLKSEVREIARKANLLTAEKKDSQGICFLGKVSLVDFLKNYIPEKRGMVLTTAGEKIGEHSGVHFYTVGQRHIGVSNHKPIYVAEKNIKTNTLVVAEGESNPALYKKEIEITNINFIQPEFISLIRANKGHKEVKVLARVRYRQTLAPAVLKIENCKLKIEFDMPVKFIAPGQSAVFYKKNGEMLGGGVII